MVRNNDNNVMMEGVRIIFRNFEGKEDLYNREGSKNFSVILDDDVAHQMAEDGWNIKWLKAREDGEAPQAYIQVSLRFDVFPPRIVLITSRGRTQLDEETVEMLDWADIQNVDLIIRPYNWSVGEKGGLKAYVKTMFVTIHEDPLEQKYAELDEIPARAGRVQE